MKKLRSNVDKILNRELILKVWRLQWKKYGLKPILTSTISFLFSEIQTLQRCEVRNKGRKIPGSNVKLTKDLYRLTIGVVQISV